MRYLVMLPVLLSVLATSGCVSTDGVQQKQWFRGNTHTHTTESDGDTAPEQVVKWYHDRGYNFLILTDHNKFVDPARVKMPADRRADFILIGGEELSSNMTKPYKAYIHSTAMNIDRLAAWDAGPVAKSQVIQFHVDETIKSGGTTILNHPNFGWSITAGDMLPVTNLYMFELFNGHPSVNNFGDADHPSTEAIWNELLTKGMLVYGVSSDDAHHFKAGKTGSNPGRGWVMVHATALDADLITRAMLQGDFYASSGVFLKTCERGRDRYRIEVDEQKTTDTLTALPETRGKQVSSGNEGYRIEFIGPDGKVLKAVDGSRADFEINGALSFVRARITYTRKTPTTDVLEQYYAWGQPVFTDGRASVDTVRNVTHHEHHAPEKK